MSKENTYLYTSLHISFYIVLFYLINTASFPIKVKNKIKEKADGKCTECNTTVPKEVLIAAHYYHGVGKYNVEQNGRALCPFCELRYHLENSDNPRKIGLSQKNNDIVVNGRFLALTEEEKEQILYTLELKPLWEAVHARIIKRKV